MTVHFPYTREQAVKLLEELEERKRKFEIKQNAFNNTWYIRNKETDALIHGFKSPQDAQEIIDFFTGE